MNYDAIFVTPKAFITVAKNRLKIYHTRKKQMIYLLYEQEFEIELFNPKKTEVLARISFQGNDITGGGIMLQPGERVFLDRFVDEPTPLVFNEYHVDLYKWSIEDDGKITIEFFDADHPYDTQISRDSQHITYGGITNPVTHLGTSYDQFLNPDVSINITTTILSHPIKKCEYRIMPISTKVYNTKELRTYCPDCGIKIKKTWNYCAKCGSKI